MSSLLDRLNAALAKKAEQDLLKASQTNDSSLDTHFDDEGWMETNATAKIKIIPTWETKVRLVDKYRLVWVPYYTLHQAKTCGVLCDNKEILGQSVGMPPEGDVVVEIFNMDKEGPRKHSRLLVIHEKDLISFNGNKRDMKYPIDSKKGFSGENTDNAWDIDLMDKMHNALEDKYKTKSGKYVFELMQKTAKEFLRLAVEEEQKNKDLADEMARAAPLQESVSPMSEQRHRVDIRSFAPAPKSVAVTQTLAEGDWICWHHKVFKESMVCAKIVKITENPGHPLELSTLDTIRGHDVIQKCYLKGSTAGTSASVAGAAPSSSSEVSSSDKKRGEAFYGREALNEVDFYRDNEGVLRPRGGSFQLMSLFKLVRGSEVVGAKEQREDEEEEEEEILSVRRKSDTLTSPNTCSGNKRHLTSVSPSAVSPVLTPPSTSRKSVVHSSPVKSPTVNSVRSEKGRSQDSVSGSASKRVKSC